jgi:hypothetical protein
MKTRPQHQQLKTQSEEQLLINGEYNRNGYEVWMDGRLIYAAGNHVQDSNQPALCKADRLPLRTLRQFCIRTAREIAAGRGGQFGGVERVKEESDP